MMEGRVRTCEPKIAIQMLIVDVHFSSSIVCVIVVVIVTLSSAPFPLGALALFPCFVAYGVTLAFNYLAYYYLHVCMFFNASLTGSIGNLSLQITP